MSKTEIVVCPGIHSTQLTESFIRGIDSKKSRNYLVLPTEQHQPYNTIAIHNWLKTHYPSPVDAPPLLFIAFSAGVVGSIGAAIAWQLQGGKIASFIAFDGWGMPLWGDFPIYRVSHDFFTHWSSRILGGGKNGFYVEPAVEHLELWRSPDSCRGWHVLGEGLKISRSLTEYLASILSERSL